MATRSLFFFYKVSTPLHCADPTDFPTSSWIKSMGSIILEATLSFCCSWLVPGDADMMMMVCVRDITENEQQMRERATKKELFLFTPPTYFLSSFFYIFIYSLVSKSSTPPPYSPGKSKHKPFLICVHVKDLSRCQIFSSWVGHISVVVSYYNINYNISAVMLRIDEGLCPAVHLWKEIYLHN